MAATYIHEGKSIDYTPAEDVAQGAVVVQGDLIGVALRSIEANRLGALQVSGVFSFAKATGEGEALSAGTKVYWNASAEQVTDDDGSGANKYLGKVVSDAGDDADIVLVRLSQ